MVPSDSAPWWRDAVIYQIYIRSFADGNGDGIGDIAGIRSRLPYLRDLGVDALWITPWYPSPMVDAGYDVADYTGIDPLFGTLPEVEDIPEALLQDPIWERSGRTARGRDGCRVPIPWAGDSPPFGFGADGAGPWLPQPKTWSDYSVEAQVGDPSSTLELYRSALRIRRARPGLGDGGLRWERAPEGVLMFSRPGGFACVVNVSGEPLPLPPHTDLLLASDRLDDGPLPSGTAAWLAVSA